MSNYSTNNLTSQFENLTLEENNINTFWNKFKSKFPKYQEYFENFSKYIRNEFGTSLPCNRFDVGNSFEFILKECIQNCGFDVDEYPNIKRIDIIINNKIPISIKFSSSGDIKLHNSNNCINTDMKMNDTILITPDKIYLLTTENIKNCGLNLSKYLKNTGDGLSLKRSILKDLIKNNFEYKINIDIKVNKNECKNRLCSEIFTKK